jgi:hypothetical protein
MPGTGFARRPANSTSWTIDASGPSVLKDTRETGFARTVVPPDRALVDVRKVAREISRVAGGCSRDLSQAIKASDRRYRLDN